MTATATPGIVWREVEGELKAFAVDESGRETEAVWAPLPGSQEAFLSCPCFEALYEGTRGPGKTDTLIMDFAQHVGHGYGAEWRGILFRQTFPQLRDLISKTKKWFKQIWPQAEFNEQKSTWTWPGGETLRLSYMQKPDDYYNYHGHAYPWIGWEELTTWADDKCYKLMMSCSRSTVPGMPRKYRATTNPYGKGHNWVKRRFQLPVRKGHTIGKVLQNPERAAIHGDLYENKILLFADPQYPERIKAAARNPSELAAWLEGSWDITSGGMFDDLWRGDLHVVPSVPLSAIPKGWRIDRAFDWGSSKPFSVGWWAESNGEPFTYKGVTYGKVRGDLYRVAEWYGWCGQRNEGVKMLAVDIAQGIKDREDDWSISHRVKVGVADSSIFDTENGVSIAEDMQKKGITWQPADKRPGSRKQGWEVMRKRLKAAVTQPREEPGLFVMDRCEQFIETVPSIPRDEKDLDDVDTDAEDHIADETRYRVRRKIAKVGQRSF